MICGVCSKQKNQLLTKKSRLLDINLLMCQMCAKAKMEPRWVIILAARQFGSDLVTDYIVNHKYVGDEIKASDIMKKT